jgi:hypothetical protein
VIGRKKDDLLLETGGRAKIKKPHITGVPQTSTTLSSKEQAHEAVIRAYPQLQISLIPTRPFPPATLRPIEAGISRSSFHIASTWEGRFSELRRVTNREPPGGQKCGLIFLNDRREGSKTNPVRCNRAETTAVRCARPVIFVRLPLGQRAHRTDMVARIHAEGATTTLPRTAPATKATAQLAFHGYGRASRGETAQPAGSADPSQGTIPSKLALRPQRCSAASSPASVSPSRPARTGNPDAAVRTRLNVDLTRLNKIWR